MRSLRKRLGLKVLGATCEHLPGIGLANHQLMRLAVSQRGRQRDRERVLAVANPGFEQALAKAVGDTAGDDPAIGDELNLKSRSGCIRAVEPASRMVVDDAFEAAIKFRQWS